MAWRSEPRDTPAMSWPSIRMRPEPTLVKPQQQIEHRRFAAARRSDQRRDLAALGDEIHAAQHRRVGTVSEPHVFERDARRGQLQRRQVVVARLAGRAVDDLVKHTHADEIVVEVDIEPGQPLGRLIGKQEGEQERNEFARLRPGLDHAVAAVDRGERDGKTAEHFHQRTGAVGDARHLVGFMLDLADADGKPAPHLVFERECLDHSHALQGFLHGLDDARAAGELHAGDAAHPADQFAKEQKRGRRHDEAGKRHHRILHHHHDAKPDQRHQIAAYCGDEKIDHLAHRGGAGGEPGDEFGRMAIGEKADVLLQELVEHAPLIIGDDPVADPRQRDGRAVGRKSFCREHRHRDQGYDHDHMEIFVHIGFVDHRAEQIGGERRGGGGDGHQHEAEGVEPPVPQRLVDQQAAHQNAGRILVRGFGHGIRPWELSCVFHFAPPRPVFARTRLSAFHARTGRNFQVNSKILWTVRSIHGNLLLRLR